MNTENVVPHLRKEAVNPVGDLLEGGVTTGIKEQLFTEVIKTCVNHLN